MFKDLMVQVNQLCGPAHIYLIFSTFAFMLLLARMITTGKFNFSSLALRLAVTYVVVFVLNWLCVKGWTQFSWFLLGWMFVFVLIILVGAFSLAHKMMDVKNVKYISLNQSRN
jgi:hypothetical protein